MFELLGIIAGIIWGGFAAVLGLVFSMGFIVIKIGLVMFIIWAVVTAINERFLKR